MERMTLLMATKAKTPFEVSTRTPARTPSGRRPLLPRHQLPQVPAGGAARRRLSAPRGTSRRRTTLGERTAIEVLVEQPEEEEDEDIISATPSP